MGLITLTEVKQYLRVDFDDDDSLIEDLINSASGWAGKYTNHVLIPISRTYSVGCYDISDFPISVDTSAVNGKYDLKNSSLSSLLTVHSGTVTLKVGYQLRSDIPEILVTAVKKLVAYMYENRDVYPSDLPFDVQVLINQYRRFIVA